VFVELMPLLGGRTVLITVAKVDDPASRDCALTSLTCDCCLRMPGSRQSPVGGPAPKGPKVISRG
jgi:hypothetical protein